MVNAGLCKTSIFLCDPETFWLFRLQDRDFKVFWMRTRDVQTLNIQAPAMRLITFSRFDEHSSPLFKSLEIIKFLDLVTFHLTIFMYKYHNKLLPSVLQNSLIIFQKQEQIMVYSISDFKVLQYGIPLMKISNYLHCLCLKRKWNSTSLKITRHLYIVWVTLKWK